MDPDPPAKAEEIRNKLTIPDAKTDHSNRLFEPALAHSLPPERYFSP